MSARSCLHSRFVRYCHRGYFGGSNASLMWSLSMKRYLVASCVIAAIMIADVQAPMPTGWKLRIDRSTSPSDPDAAGNVKLTTVGTGFHAVNPQAATYWTPNNRAMG